MTSTHIAWAIDFLNQNDFILKSKTPDIIQNAPWATVYRFNTNQGYVFLKKVPSALAQEPKIIKVLQETFKMNVPNIIAENPEEKCFLMRDAGMQLHEFLKQQSFNQNIIINTLNRYSNFQIGAMENLNIFLKLEIPDWRLSKLPDLYNKIISQEKLLLNDGITKDELIKLKKLESRFITICEQLSKYSVKDTFSHSDFHDKNILIDLKTRQTTIIDLGEVAINHPFFSLHNFLHRSRENFKLSSEQYNEILINCFEPWADFESQENLLKILSLINQCWPIHAILTEYRLLNSVDCSSYDVLSRQGRFANKLRFWIEFNKIIIKD